MTVFIAAAAGGNWSSAPTWSSPGGAVPTATDDVQLSALTGTLTIDGTSGSPSLCRSLDATGATGMLNHGAAKQLNVGDPAGGGTGVFKLVAGLTYTPATSGILKFVATTGTNNITTAGKTLPTLVFDGVGATWQFQDSFTQSTAVTFTLNNGVVDSNNQTVIIGSFSSNNGNARGLKLGSSTLTAGAVGSTLPWDIGTNTNFTLTPGTSTIVLPQTTAAATFAGGGLIYATVSATALTTGSITITGANTFGTLTLSQGANTGGSYKLGANQTITGTFTFNCNSLLNRAYITSDTKGTARTITAATVTTNGGDLQDIVGAGAGSWNISGSTFGGGDCGGNSGITFNTPKNCFAKTAVSANLSSATLFFTTSGGVTQITPAYPMPQDTLKFDANSVTTTGKTITVDGSAIRLPAIDWTGVLNTPAFAISNSTSFFGSIKLVSGMTISGTQLVTLEGRGSQTITTAGLTWTTPITVNCAGGTWTQQDAFASSNNTNPSFVITSGTLAAGANNTTLSGASAKFTVNGGSFTGSATLSLTGATAANITVSSGDLNMPSGIVSITGASSTMTLSGGTAEIGTLTRTGFTLTIAGTAVQIGTGGAAYATSLTISSGSIAPTIGNKITSVSATAIAVSANSGGSGGSFTFS